MFVRLALFITAMSTLPVASAATLQELGFTDVVTLFDGEFIGWKDGQYCEGRIEISGASERRTWRCESRDRACEPHRPNTCLDVAFAARAHDAELAESAMLVACQMGTPAACRGFPFRDGSPMEPYHRLYAVGCATGDGEACARSALLAKADGDLDGMLRLSEASCRHGFAQGCLMSEVQHANRGNVRRAVEYRAVACHKDPKLAVCAEEGS